MTGSIGWFHPKDDSDQWDGFNDPGIENFLGSPLRHLAREICQNTLDARRPECDAASVSFYKKDVLPQDIPDIEGVQEIIKSCREAANDEGIKAQTFFERAQGLVEGHTVPVLLVSDFNTTGLTGPCEKGTPYYAFMKAEGQSQKDLPTATGSYGIGKFAPYALSGLRTVFVSTAFQNRYGEIEELVQGKSILMSHDGQDGARRRGTGFWGYMDKCKPVDPNLESELVPEWLRRPLSETGTRKLGTTIAVIGFLPEEEDDKEDLWREVLAASAMENFFGSIQYEKLIVSVDNHYEVDSRNLAQLFSNQEMRRAVEDQKNEPELFDRCGYYLEAISTPQDNNEAFCIEHQNRDLNFCRMQLLLREGLPKRVCVLRNGMFINDYLDRLKQFHDYKDFVAVVECLSEEGNTLLRGMEPPRHDDFEPSRLPGTAERKRGKRALKNLKIWVRDTLRSYARTPVSEVTRIDELANYLGEEAPGQGSGEGSEPNPEGPVIFTPKIASKLSPSGQPGGGEGTSQGTEEAGGSGGGGGRGSSGGAGSGSRTGEGTHSRGRPSRSLSLQQVRAVPTTDETRKVAFTPVESSKARIELSEAGADEDFGLRVVDSDRGIVRKGGIEIDLIKGQRETLNVRLSGPVRGAIRVDAYEVQ